MANFLFFLFYLFFIGAAITHSWSPALFAPALFAPALFAPASVTAISTPRPTTAVVSKGFHFISKVFNPILFTLEITSAVGCQYAIFAI